MAQSIGIEHRTLAMAGIDVGMGAEPNLGIRFKFAGAAQQHKIGTWAASGGDNGHIVLDLPGNENKTFVRGAGRQGGRRVTT